jgi:Fur family ferric uptake transcriptional regulator
MRRTQTQLLREHQLRSTASRSSILSIFLRNSYALSYSDIERLVATTYDRVTVYRTLKTFLDKGVIHKVLDDGGGLKYALCNELCGNEHHHDHVHFKCSRCGQTNCLENVEVPGVRLPSGYSVSEKDLLLHGICPNCQS